jgi:hypothetical protein
MTCHAGGKLKVRHAVLLCVVLQASVLAAVVLLALLSLLVLSGNAWLEGNRVLGSKAGSKSMAGRDEKSLLMSAVCELNGQHVCWSHLC